MSTMCMRGRRSCTRSCTHCAAGAARTRCLVTCFMAFSCIILTTVATPAALPDASPSLPRLCTHSGITPPMSARIAFHCVADTTRPQAAETQQQILSSTPFNFYLKDEDDIRAVNRAFTGYVFTDGSGLNARFPTLRSAGWACVFYSAERVYERYTAWSHRVSRRPFPRGTKNTMLCSLCRRAFSAPLATMRIARRR